MSARAPPPTDDFDVVADAQSKALTRTVCLAGATVTVALAPYDLALAGDDPHAAKTLAAMRVALLAVFGGYFVLYRLVAHRRGGARLLQAPALLACGVFGAAVGQLARDDSYWLTTLYMAPIMCGVVVMRLPERLLNAALFVLTPLAGFALSFDGALSEAHVAHAVGLFVMAAAFGVFAGDTFYKLFRRAFELQREVDRRGAALAESNALLEHRVEVQTRDLRRLAARLDDALEAERRRLARELHDDLGQELTAMRLEVEALRAVSRDADVARRVERVAASIERSHGGVRLILESLRPRILDEEGVEASVHWLARQYRERTGRACEARVALYDEPDPAVGLAVFRIVQEALTNASRHADAARVEVSLAEAGLEVTLTITDDGRGLAAEGAAHRHGLVGMRERAIAVGGTLEVDAAGPAGTRVTAVLPTRRRDSAQGEERP